MDPAIVRSGAITPRARVTATPVEDDGLLDNRAVQIGGAAALLGIGAIAARRVFHTRVQPSAADGLDLLQRRALAETSPAYPTVVLGGNGLEAAADAKLAPHFIRRQDVAAWLANSQVKNTVHHGVRNERAYYGILLDGARVKKNHRSEYGQGLYTAMRPGSWGGRNIEVAVQVHNPAFDDTTAKRANDATIVRRWWASDWIVGHRDNQIKLVVDLPGQAPGPPTDAPQRWNAPPVAQT